MELRGVSGTQDAQGTDLSVFPLKGRAARSFSCSHWTPKALAFGRWGAGRRGETGNDSLGWLILIVDWIEKH
jgi:hypothetical protein